MRYILFVAKGVVNKMDQPKWSRFRPYADWIKGDNVAGLKKPLYVLGRVILSLWMAFLFCTTLILVGIQLFSPGGLIDHKPERECQTVLAHEGFWDTNSVDGTKDWVPAEYVNTCDNPDGANP